MPTKKGEIDGKPCEFPVLDLCDKEQKLGFLRLIQTCFLGFMKSPKYVSFEKQEKRDKMNRAKKKMTFVDLPRKNTI